MMQKDCKRPSSLRFGGSLHSREHLDFRPWLLPEFSISPSCHEVASAFSPFDSNSSCVNFSLRSSGECERRNSREEGVWKQALTRPRRLNWDVSGAAGCAVSIHWWIFWVIRHSWVLKWSWFTEGSGVIRWLGLQHHAMTSHTPILRFGNDSLTRALISFIWSSKGN